MVCQSWPLATSAVCHCSTLDRSSRSQSNPMADADLAAFNFFCSVTSAVPPSAYFNIIIGELQEFVTCRQHEARIFLHVRLHVWHGVEQLDEVDDLGQEIFLVGSEQAARQAWRGAELTHHFGMHQYELLLQLGSADIVCQVVLCIVRIVCQVVLCQVVLCQVVLCAKSFCAKSFCANGMDVTCKRGSSRVRVSLVPFTDRGFPRS